MSKCNHASQTRTPAGELECTLCGARFTLLGWINPHVRETEIIRQSLGELAALPRDAVRNVTQTLAGGTHIACGKGSPCDSCAARWATVRLVEAVLTTRSDQHGT